MNRVLLFVLLCFSLQVSAFTSFESRELQLAASKYQLTYELDLKNKILAASGLISVKNISNTETTHIPLRLFRLLSVTSVSDDHGNDLAYKQQVLSNEDWPILQTNYIEISLAQPLKPQANYSFHIEFKGHLTGYSETGMKYVNDSISEQFSILRMDAFAYPLVTYPNDKVNRLAKFWLHRYDYDMTFVVPDGYTVANGGQLVTSTKQKQGQLFRYKNKLPAWRMDFAIAKYQQFNTERYSVFSWESAEKSRALLAQIEKTFALYQHWFGPLQQHLGYTFIEVPQGYGAQADVTAVIQDAAGFNQLNRLYHEISHQWNVKSLDVFSPRWNEGLATFLEHLTVETMGEEGHLANQTEIVLQNIRDSFERQPLYHKTPFVDYGKAGLNSYSVGMIFFHLLFDVLGESEFNQIIGGFYRAYYQTGATTETFIQYVKNHSDVELSHFFNEWVYTATYTKRVNQFASYPQLLAFYRNKNQ